MDDDDFIIWLHGPHELSNFLDLSNSIHQNTQFMMEQDSLDIKALKPTRFYVNVGPSILVRWWVIWLKHAISNTKEASII
jgi:hypothetical protein